MDLSIFVVILVGTLVSLLGLHFFLLKPLSGKSFEEMVKEKQEMREKILGAAGSTKAASKDNTNKKVKKVNKKPQHPKQKASAVVKDSDQDSAEVESDSNSSESQMEEEINPLTYALKKTTAVSDFVETEAFSLNDGQGKKKENKTNQGKKNKQKGGILLNKAEPVLVKQDVAVEMNHFEEIQPKDALEIARQQKEEDTKVKSQPKEQRKHKNKEHHKTSPKNSGVEEIAITPTAAPAVVTAATIAVPTEAKITASVVNKEKSSKKKKNELLTQQLAAEVQDAANVQSFVNILGKADLPRNDIQILIDFLLNKQQDTLTKDPSEWNDPSDPLQKLKKQLQEKENQLQEEQTGAAGLHAKLKELRQELNNEKSHNSSAAKNFNEEMNAKRLEIQNLTQQIQHVSDKLTAEKQTVSHQYQQLQAKYVQLSEKHAAAQESAATVAQLNDNLQLLQHELLNKNQLLNEKIQIEEEMLKKKTEYEILLHNKDEIIQQRTHDVAAYENELQQLRVVTGQKDELAKTCQQQDYELEQLKAQLVELQAKQKQAVAAVAAAAAVSNQNEESSKVEIRNLQNALDSSKTELSVCRGELSDCKTKLAEHDQQMNEARLREENLQKQIEEQRTKNNDLRVKNWKLIDALRDAENNTNGSTNPNHSSKVELEAASKVANHIIEPAPPTVDIDKVILEEQTRTKDLLIKLLPAEIVSALPLDATNFHSWLESTVICIREQQESVRISNSNSSKSAEVTHLNNSSISSTSKSSNSANSNSNSHPNNDEGSNSSSKNGAPELDSYEDQQVLVLRNEQLQKTVDQYKTIIADTEIMLKNLESKVIEQDVHWRSVVQAKDKELNLLKSAGALQ
ncbi:ribosome-binding protein 1 isoform X1 [Toxorhynchites rutilus septentrionalis]|uniref:ribosome-binding protein 1 isoform X1 n=1 Tax=Toxorhynchites rutilus septentrionalis TaxID=329112 RepID=UPI00247AAEFE|nr:ribosome-binding protein 1 isoform X1 [Toxorhynchites rutilus septentrionalis]